ncbi:MAG: galactokinase [Lachnospiraceae bacterium]|nr:galactokinase [Lachnospiraceae bacterium]
MQTEVMIKMIENGELDDRLLDIYVDATKLVYQKGRYINAIRCFETYYGASDVNIFSAPGRSEVGGNHTDHQHGEVLAASINLDTIAVVRATEDKQIKIISDDYDEVVISLDDLEAKEEEKETTIALIKGVLAGFVEGGHQIGGFCAYATSDVLIGAGLSSSAAFETLIGTILSGLYNNMSVSPVEIAMIGQYAENVYFGKPCGLMDQMACSVGNLVHIDFENPKDPKVEKLDFNMSEHGYSLCITDTKGSHADLTAEYAAVPQEMKAVANYFGKEVLRDVTYEEVFREIATLRKTLGDRSVLRAVHFLRENERVVKEVNALKWGDMNLFLDNVKESGDSSFKYLQNVYSSNDVENQNISIALMMSDVLLKTEGVSRVHGGGFAGTIQAFVKNDFVANYKENMDHIFGEGSCKDLRIRKYGGMKVL